MSTATILIDRYNEIAEKAGYVIASFGLEIQERDQRIAELEKTIAVIKDITLDGELSWKEKHKWISKEVDDE